MPTVSIVVPCYNEQATICLLLDAVYQQTFPRSEMEVLVVDGLSTDHTREEIARFQAIHSDLDIRVIDNPKRIIPAGLNRGIEASLGQYIVRLDAHSVPKPDYVERCIQALQAGCGENVGGVWEIRPGNQSWIGRSIAVAAAHPLGVGDARYRYSDRAEIVDTVPFGAFNRSLLDRIGMFDESLLTNEDYEFNTRIRQQGGKVWLDPAIRSVYFARSTLSDLAKQYWRYGFWKLRMLRRYPGSLRWRQALPPIFVISLLVFALASLVFPMVSILLVLELAGYIGVLVLIGIWTALKSKDSSLAAGLPVSISVMHISWGAGFLWSLLQNP